MRRGACDISSANDDRNVAEQRTVAIDASTGQVNYQATHYDILSN